MTIKSEWRLAELLGQDEDPFARVILSTGLHVDLTGTEEELAVGLKETLALEGRLFDRGITCELKDGGQDCLDCPMYVADREEEKRAPLCRLGRDQRLIEVRYQERRREPFVELAQRADELTEIGHIEPEYAELLTFVGL